MRVGSGAGDFTKGSRDPGPREEVILGLIAGLKGGDLAAKRSIEGLERSASRGGLQLEERLMLSCAKLLGTQWVAAARALAPHPPRPLTLSPALIERWTELALPQQNKSSLVLSLQCLDRIISLGFPKVALFIARSIAPELASATERSLFLFEAGRLGILYKEVSSGVELFRELLFSSPEMRTQIREELDQSLSSGVVIGDDLEDLFQLRLRHIEESAERWGESLLRRGAAAQRAQLALRFGTCAEFQIDAPALALFFYQRGLELGGAADALLEGLQRLALSGSEDAAGVYRDALAAHRGPIAVLEWARQWASSLPPNERGEALWEVALEAFRSAEPEIGSKVLIQLARLPAGQAILYRGLRVAKEQGLWPLLDQLFERLGAQSADTSQRRQLLKARVILHMEELKAPLSAYALISSAPALLEGEELNTLLERLFSDPESQKGLIERLEEKIKSSPDSNTRQESEGHLVQLLRRVGRVDEALMTVRAALERDQEGPRLQGELIELLCEQEDWPALAQEAIRATSLLPAESLLPKIQQLLDQEGPAYETLSEALTSELYRSNAQLLERRGGAPSERRAAWSQYLSRSPNDRSALTQLARLCESRESWLEWSQHAERALEGRLIGRVGLLEQLTERLEWLWGEASPEVMPLWDQLFELKSDHALAAQRVIESALSDGDGEGAWAALCRWSSAEALSPHLRELRRSLSLQAAKLRGGGEWLLSELESGELPLDRQLLIETAYSKLSREGARRLRTLLLEGAGTLLSPSERKKIFALLGDLLGADLFTARVAWESAWHADREDLAVITRLLELYGALVYRSGLRRLLGDALARPLSRKAKNLLLRHAAVIWEFDLGDWERAAECWWLFIEEQPRERVHALIALRRIYQAAGDQVAIDQLATYEREHARDPATQARALWDQVQLRLDPPKLRPEALQLLDLLDSFRPPRPEQVALGEALAVPLGAWNSQSARYQAYAEHLTGLPRGGLLYAAAEIEECRLGRRREALRLYREAASFGLFEAQESLARLGETETS